MRPAITQARVIVSGVPGGPNATPGDITRALAAILNDEFSRVPMSQRALAPLIGVSPSQLSKYLRGERVLNIEQIDAICRELGLSIVEIIDAADFARRAG